MLTIDNFPFVRELIDRGEKFVEQESQWSHWRRKYLKDYSEEIKDSLSAREVLIVESVQKESRKFFFGRFDKFEKLLKLHCYFNNRSVYPIRSLNGGSGSDILDVLRNLRANVQYSLNMANFGVSNSSIYLDFLDTHERVKFPDSESLKHLTDFNDKLGEHQKDLWNV